MQSLAHVPAGKAGAPIRILQITDTHLFPDGVVTFKTPKRTVDMKKENYSNETAERMLKILVEKVKPDIVIFTGDIIDGRPFGEHKRSDFVETFEKFLRPVIDTKIAWSFTPGNHDDDGAPYSRKDLLKLYELPCCLSAGAKTFNHTVLVGPSAKECVRLWFFDSGENADERIKYTSFDLSAVQGYCALSDKYHKAGERCLGLAYFHIPFPEYAYNKPIRGKLGLFDAARHKGIVPPVAKLFPSLVKLAGSHRVVGSSRLDSGLFREMARRANVVATFCGHDHYNDAVMRRDGLFLCYGRVCSRTPPIDWEGDGGELPFDFGARVVEVNPNGGHSNTEEKPHKCITWIQGESGVEEDSVFQLHPAKPQKPSALQSCFKTVAESKNLPRIAHLVVMIALAAYILMYSENRTKEDDA